MSSPSLAVVPRFVALYAGLLLLASWNAQAVPPAAPSDTTVEFTRYGFPYNNTANAPANTWYSWYLTWKDNAIDEDGYQVFIRFGTGGPFFPADQLGPNSTSARISTGIPSTGTGTPVHFQIVPWKFNGSSTESNPLNVATTIPAPDGKPALAPPSGLTATSLDLDPSPTVVLADDGQVVLTWTDNSSQELHYAIEMREHTEANNGTWTFVGTMPFNSTKAVLSNRTILPSSTSTQTDRLQLVPGKTYEFKIRTGRGYLNGVPEFSDGANTTTPTQTAAPHFKVPDLRAPSNLSASASGESQISLSWTDNSNNETGYEVQYRIRGDEADPPWLTLGTLGENSTSVNIPVPQKASAEFQVRAQYSYRPSGATSNTILYSPFSTPPVLTSTTDFKAPTALAAVTSGVSRTIDLSWTDNSSTEVGFNVYCRAAGTSGAFLFCRAVPANVTKVSVDSFTTGDPLTANPPITEDPSGTLSFTPFTIGNSYEFVVRAVGSSESVFSLDSNTAVATARDGFTSRLYQPITQGQAFSHTVTLSNMASVSPLTASALPAGLSFNPSTGQITGTPTETGYFPITLRATYSAGYTAEVILMLRILPALGAPTLTDGADIDDRTLGLNDPMVIPLTGRYTDADTEYAVRIDTTKGVIDLGLYYTLAPQTVNNFANYVLNGDFSNMVFHRLVPGFVLQGGFLKAVSAPRTFTRVSARPSPLNEPGISNLRGTVAMAKLGARDSIAYRAATASTNPRDDTYGYVGDPNSASVDFFFNLSNNSANLDNQNGGFTTFARVATPGLTVMDAIAALPRGSYLNNNASDSTYNSSLDKRIIIDGSLTPLTNIPMDAATVPADMDISKTVRVNSITFINPVTYTVDSQSENIASVVVENGSQLRVTGLAAGTRPVVLTAKDVDGNTKTMSFSINVQPGYKRPAITKQPVPVVAKTNAKATFSVSATGTSLVYRWRKDGEILPGQTGAGSPTFAIPSVQNSNEGLYDVQVSNDAETIISSRVRLDVIKPPVIGDDLPHKLVEVGAELKLDVDLDSGSPAPVFTWKRGSSTLAKQTGKTLLINAASLADAGVYQASARNSAGTDESSKATVIVINKNSQLQVEKPGTTIRINAPAAGPDLLYQWYKDGSKINAGTARFSGTQDAVLTIEFADPIQDVGSYTCEIETPEGLGTHMSGAIILALSGKPLLNPLTGLYALRDGIVGNGYQYYLPYDRTSSNNASIYSITGLPPGLAYDKATGFIYGRPTKAGSYAIRATATNKSGTSDPVTGTLRIFPLGAGLCGTFAANVNPSASLNDNKGGRVLMTVTDSGAFSASLQLGKETYKAKSSLIIYDTTTDSSGNSLIVYAALVQIPRKGKASLNFIVQVTEGTNSFVGTVNDGTNSASFQGHRLIWDRTRRPLSGKAQGFNLALEPETAKVGQVDTPQGSGYATLTLDGSGTTTLAGKLSDGTSFTSSSFASQTLAAQNEAQTATRLELQTDFFLRLNKDTASLLPALKLVLNSTTRLTQTNQAFNRLEGKARWIKTAQPASERIYRPGFSATELNVIGSLYVPPGTNRIVMGLPNVTGNAVLDFSEGGLGTATPNPDISSFRITSSHVGSISVANPAEVTFNVTPTTGLFRGTFKLSDSRKVNFEGLCINDSISDPAYGSAYRPPLGAGFFLLPGTTPSLTKSAILSGKVSLKTPIITFTTQPVSQIVNASTVSQSTTVTFTAAATGIPGIVYQWYFNGDPITAATGQTYSIVGVGSAHVGSYVCVASSGVIQTASNTATLSLTTPVSSVTIARTPTDGTVSAGSAVTYTATANGSEPITYQWYNGTTAIEGATGKTYTFVAQTGNAGAYKVTAKNTLNATPVESAADTLVVNVPVTVVTVTRTPSSTALRPNTGVQFTASPNGTGTMEYQWYKETDLIAGATSSTYSIDNLNYGDAGNYLCRVKNAVTADPVSSNTVALEVRDLVYNVVATRDPQNEYVASGSSSVTFSVDSSGGGVKVYSWRRGSEVLAGGDQQTLTLPSVTSADSGTYVCHVTSDIDPTGMDSNPVQLVVIDPITTATLALQTPLDTTVAPNTTLTFQVTSDGGGTKNYSLKRDGSVVSTGTSDSLIINAPQVAGIYVYSVQVTNPVTSGGVQSNTVTITVETPN